ncbi:hypothetical protein Lal_00030247 [Lupinus albus]|nr:hypothetical protein Lal_00030247 [Lupinus albus]
MASSLKRPRTSNSKQGESSSKSNPLNLTRLLENDAQRKVFEENFHGRAIFTPKYDNIGNFEFEDFLFPYLLRQQKLFDFCCEVNDIYLELVQVFYCNMNFRKNLMTSDVKGKDIVLDIKTFGSICCDIPMTGDISICRIPKEEIEKRKQQRLGETVKNSVSLDGETKVALNLRESKVDIEVVHKMGFVIDPITLRTYKHCTDRQTAPTDEPEPTVPNQHESHAPSSLSTAMPTNQMIMDELVSLRGYITTRMDAFDTQSQQIHYELHRLSSRLSNIDVDEDSSEPES